MPCISGNFNPTTGPLMQVAITRLYVSAEESDAAEGVPTLHMFQAMSVQGLEFNKGVTSFDVLLGRDIICSGALSLSFDGHFLLSL